MKKIKLFLASSIELKDDRKEFEIFINRKNKMWIDKDIFLELIIWEDFLDAMSATSLQDEYNKAIRECDYFVMLFATKVGKYTEEEFDTAFKQYKSTSKPLIFTYFKDSSLALNETDQNDVESLQAFKEKIKELGHFYTRYRNIEGLREHFGNQLDKLVNKGFIEIEAGESSTNDNNYTTYSQTATKIYNITHIDKAEFN